MIVHELDSYTELLDLSGDHVLLSTTYHGANIITTHPAIVIYSQIGEYLGEDHIRTLFRNHSDTNYYIFLVTHDVPRALMHELKHRASFIRLKYAYAYYSNNLAYSDTNFNKIINTLKTRHFLSLNNRASWPRQGLFYFFHNFNLLDKIYLSYHGNLLRSMYSSLSDIDKIFFLSEKEKVWYTKNVDFSNIRKKIPFSTVADSVFPDSSWDEQGRGIGKEKYYADCFCSVVTETYCYEPSAYFTEKVFKPLVFFQPFLIHGNAGSLKELHTMGFKTFSQWWDESYDELVDHRRFEAMLRVILEISSWSLEKINEVYREMMPVLEHNHNHFTKVLPELYNAEIAQVKNQIADIIKSQS